MAKAKKINPKEVLYAVQAVKISNAKVRLLNDLKEYKKTKMTPGIKEQLTNYVFGLGENPQNPFEEVQKTYDSAVAGYDEEFEQMISQVTKEKGKK